MKTYILILVISITSLSFAQKGELYLGAEGGLNSNKAQTWGGEDGSKAQFGVMGEYYLSHRWSAKMKLKYYEVSIVPGTLCENPLFADCDPASRTSYQAKMLTIPLLAKWEFGGGRLKGYVQGGVYLGLETEADYVNYNPKYEDVKTDFGLVLGLGVQYAVFGKRLVLYSEVEGLKGIQTKGFHKATLVTNDQDIRLFNLHTSVGVKFKLFKRGERD